MNPGAALADVAARRPRLASFTAAYVVLGVVASIVRGDRRVWPYVVVLVALTSAAALAGARGRLPGRVLWALSALGLAHVVGGLAPSPQARLDPFYETWLLDGVLKYDQLVHAFGTGVLTAAAWVLVGRWLDPARAGAGVRAVLAAACAMALGALNEAFEFLSAQRFRSLRVGDGVNAGWDLTFNAGGAAAVACYLVLSSWAAGRSGG